MSCKAPLFFVTLTGELLAEAAETFGLDFLGLEEPSVFVFFGGEGSDVGNASRLVEDAKSLEALEIAQFFHGAMNLSVRLVFRAWQASTEVHITTNAYALLREILQTAPFSPGMALFSLYASLRIIHNTQPYVPTQRPPRIALWFLRNCGMLPDTRRLRKRGGRS